MLKVPIEVSARHIHLSKKDLESLFGKGYKLTKKYSLNQPEEFAAKETITIKNKDGEINNIRIIGPVRLKTQAEISITDCFKLRIKPAVKNSGDLKGSSGAILIGPRGECVIKEGIIVPARHIHISNKEVKALNLANGQIVSVRVKGNRAVLFCNVLVRASDKYKFFMHIDTDEGNAAGINKNAIGEIV